MNECQREHELFNAIMRASDLAEALRGLLDHPIRGRAEARRVLEHYDHGNEWVLDPLFE